MFRYYVRYRGYKNEQEPVFAIGEFIVSEERERNPVIIMWFINSVVGGHVGHHRRGHSAQF